MFCFAWNHMAQRATPNKSHLVCPLSLGELMVFLSFINAENVYFPMFLMFLTVFRYQSSGLPTSAMLYHLCNALQPDAAASWWKWKMKPFSTAPPSVQPCISIMYTPSLNHQRGIILQGLLTFRPHMQHLPTTRVYRVYRLGWNCTESVPKIFGLWTKLTHPSVHTKLVMEFHLPNWYSSIYYIYFIYNVFHWFSSIAKFCSG